MKKLLGVVLCVLFVATSAQALSPPWYVVQHELDLTIGASPCVSVGEIDTEQNPYTLDVTACSDDVASALGVIVRRNWTYGNVKLHVRVLNPAGQEVASGIRPGADPVATVKAQFQTALADNPLFTLLLEPGGAPTDTNSFWVQVKNRAIQFFNDDLRDYYGNAHMVAQNGFRQVCVNSFFKGAVRVGWTTAPDGQ